MWKLTPIGHQQAADETTPASGGRRRRGATAMEYLVALTFIIVVAIIAIQHLGDIARGLFQNSADATSNNQKAP